MTPYSPFSISFHRLPLTTVGIAQGMMMMERRNRTPGNLWFRRRATKSPMMVSRAVEAIVK